MERLTKIDDAGRNFIEVKKFCKDDDWIISEKADGITIRFHSKAIDKLAELEDFMEEQGFEDLDTFRMAISLNQLMNKAGVEHFKENQALKDRWEKLKEFVNTPKEIQQWDERFEVTVDSIKAKMQELELADLIERKE